MPNNTPITDAELAELRRLHAAAIFRYGVRADDSAWYSIGDPTTGPHIQGDIYADEETLDRLTTVWNAFPGLIARLEAAELEREGLEAEVEELRANSIEYEKDCTKALCSLAREFDYEWDGDGATADDLREFISTTLTELQKQAKRLREGGR